MRAFTIRQIVLGLALAGVAVLEVACNPSEANKPAVAEAPVAPLTVPVVTAESRNLPGGVDVTGTLMADAQTDVAAEGAGRVLAVNIERGTVVKAGTVLARLDGEDARNQLAEAEAIEGQTAAKLGLKPGAKFDSAETPDAQKARATMEWAQADHERYVKLVDQGLVSRADYELRRSQYLSARAQYEAEINTARQLYQTLLAQRARAGVARKAAEDVEIRAPWDGLVSEKHVQPGQFVQRATKIATLVRVDPLRVELAVPETAVATVRKGQKVEFAVQAYPEQTFTGTVAYVGPSLRPETRALVVEALVPNRDGRLSPGLFATARIELPSARPSVVVPASAVRTEAGLSTAFIVKNERAELRLVQMGREVPGGLIEIQRGIVTGEQVVARPVEKLGDGAYVVAGEAR